MLTQLTVDHYASGMQIDTYVAERDIVLTYVLKILDNAGLLQNLVFKGGTCLKKIYYGKDTRFSEDLDFTSLDPDDVDESIGDLAKTFDKKKYYDITFKIKDDNLKEEGITLSYRPTIEYQHEWNKAEFHLDISYREKPALSIRHMPLKEEMYFENLEFQNFRVPSFEKEELMAEKIRAASQRLRPRDVYDLYRHSRTAYDKNLVRTLAVIKCWNVCDSLQPDRLLANIQNGRLKWEKDLRRLIRPRHFPDTRKMVKDTVKHYSYLTRMDKDIQQISNDAKKHKLYSKVEQILSKINRQ
jgi:predicted nucleotidyltransferase component of viral defense system